MIMNQPTEITRSTLAVLCIGLLIATCLWIMRPFLFSLGWAVTYTLFLAWIRGAEDGEEIPHVPGIEKTS